MAPMPDDQRRRYRRERLKLFRDQISELPNFSISDRIKVLREMGMIADITFVLPLLQYLAEEPEPDVQHAIAQVFGAIGQEATAVYLEILNETDVSEEAQIALYAALSVNNVTGHIPMMIRSLLNPKLISYVKECLLQLDILAVPAVLENISHPNPEIRFQLKPILAALPESSVVHVLELMSVIPDEATLREILGDSLIDRIKLQQENK